jgi:hypothetical protein
MLINLNRKKNNLQSMYCIRFQAQDTQCAQYINPTTANSLSSGGVHPAAINSLSGNNDVLSSQCTNLRTAHLQQQWPQGIHPVPISTMTGTSDTAGTEYQFFVNQAGKTLTAHYIISRQFLRITAVEFLT